MTAGGQVWAWQLVFSLAILLLDVNPWHLLWLGLVSITLAVIVSRIYRGRMLAARYPDIEKTIAKADQEPSWIEETAAQYLRDEVNRNAFFGFLKEYPPLKEAFHSSWGAILSPQRPLTRGRLAIIFNQIGVRFANSGDMAGATRSFACSSLYIKGNPLTWAAIAEAACADEDRVAAVWAKKVINFRLTKSASSDLQEFLSTEESKDLLREARRKMKAAVEMCEKFPSWRDTSELVGQMGVTLQYFDR
ncbi:MAG: hypothetical protein ABSA85_03515 [Terracidiphilus sp.]|jgi:hypothetical protein